MFISKKKMEEKICEALEKERERVWQMERIDHIERDLYRNIEALECRIRELEKIAKIDQIVCDPCEKGPMPSIR